jgi:hypothetical protein
MSASRALSSITFIPGNPLDSCQGVNAECLCSSDAATTSPPRKIRHPESPIEAPQNNPRVGSTIATHAVDPPSVSPGGDWSRMKWCASASAALTAWRRAGMEAELKSASDSRWQHPRISCAANSAGLTWTVAWCVSRRVVEVVSGRVGAWVVGWVAGVQ